MEEYYELNIIPKYKNIINYQKEYIKFLEEEIGKCTVCKHYECTEDVYNKGEKLRNNITLAEKKWQKKNISNQINLKKISVKK